jgi:hypothetical protein
LDQEQRERKPRSSPAEIRARQADWDQYWNQHNYWFHYQGIIFSLKTDVFRHRDGPSSAERLASAQKAERECGVAAEVSAEGTVKFHPASPSTAGKKVALQNAAAIAIYSKLQAYDLKTGAVRAEGDPAPGTAVPVK